MSEVSQITVNRVNEHLRLAVCRRKHFGNMSDVAMGLSNAIYYMMNDGYVEKEVYEGIDAMLNELKEAQAEKADFW